MPTERATPATAAYKAPAYRQVVGSRANVGLGPLLDELKGVMERYISSPVPQARAIFALAGMEEDLPQITALAETWKAHYRTLVVIGAGGSGTSGKALAMLHTGPHLVGARSLQVLDNLDAITLPSLLASLKLAECCFLVVSKSGGTVETIAQLLVVLKALEESKVRDLSQRMAVIATRSDNPLRALAAQHNIPALDHDHDLCGRFSILSAVGLIPATFMGIDIHALRRGAALGLQANLDAKQPSSSAAAIGAALQVAMIRQGRNISLLMPYSEQLCGLAVWWRQSWAESLGKQGRGSTPLIATGTADQHSQLQLFLDGPDDKFYTLLTTACAGKGPRLPDSGTGLACLSGRTLGDVVAAMQQATVDTLERHGRPLRIFEVKQVDAFTVGALLMHFTLEILFTAGLLGINPFDQPAVEESKRLAHEYLMRKP